MKKAVYLLAILFIIILGVNGCAPTKQTVKKVALSSERLINKLEANRRKILNFEGTGTMIVNSDELKTKASFKVTLIKPDSISLTIMGPFGIELAQSLVTKESFKFYDALHNTLFVGKTSEDILEQIFRINLPFNDLIDAFIGSVNLTDHLYKIPTKFFSNNNFYKLTYIDSLKNNTTQYTIDTQGFGIVDYLLFDNTGDVLLSGKYSKFRMIENVAVPFDIDVQNNKANQQVKIHYKKIITNSDKLTINFNLPDDVTVLKW